MGPWNPGWYENRTFHNDINRPERDNGSINKTLPVARPFGQVI